MALKKKKVGALSKKAVVSRKKKAAKRPVLKKSPIKPIKKEDLSETPDLYERARWKKERREYWRNRFRKILANLSSDSKVKK
ncbi:MAG: hypothetical protein LLH30_03140 [Candidatus Manganitrophus sp. SA1]|nr:hypothetical protein [Candidatus Manganitrophus morganii]